MEEFELVKISNGFRAKDLDFLEEKILEEKIQQIPTPDQLPLAPRSETLEALISQNEDLSARLKIHLKRFAILEEQKNQALESQSKMQQQLRNLQAEAEIFAEKEKLWKGKIAEAEIHKPRLEAQSLELQELKEKLVRYQRYHEKIKSQVKPFVLQLKSYAESLGREIQSLQQELHLKDQSLSESAQAQEQLRAELLSHVQRTEERMALLGQHYEKRLELQNSELRQMKAYIESLELKCQAYTDTREREDELENMLIRLRRDMEHQLQLANQREMGLRQELTSARSEINVLRSQNLAASAARDPSFQLPLAES